MNERPFLIPALLIAAAAVPLILGLVPRNRLYGVRTPRTLSADRIWYPANRLGGGVFFAASVLLGLLVLHLGAFVLPLFGGVAVVACYTRSLGRGEP
jgi:uncharacterized membrane protein